MHTHTHTHTHTQTHTHTHTEDLTGAGGVGVIIRSGKGHLIMKPRGMLPLTVAVRQMQARTNTSTYILTYCYY